MVHFVTAQPGWMLHCINPETGLPYDGEYRPDPIVAWRIAEVPDTVCEPVIVGLARTDHYVCISPEGHVIDPGNSVFMDMSAFRRHLMRQKDAGEHGG